jgi:hypothetical protein
MDLGRLTYASTQDLRLPFEHPELGPCRLVWSKTWKRIYVMAAIKQEPMLALQCSSREEATIVLPSLAKTLIDTTPDDWLDFYNRWVSMTADRSSHRFPPSSTVPLDGQYLLRLLAPRERRDDLIGDLEEEYHQVEADHGHRKAVIWYWTQVVLSLGPLVPRAVKGWLLVTLRHWLEVFSRVGDWLTELRHWIGQFFL